MNYFFLEISMSVMYFPSLDTDGWITDYSKIADKMMAHFLLSNYSQTSIYLGKISSLAYIIQNNQPNINNILSGIQLTLETYLGRVYPQVIVETADSTTDHNSSNVSISIYINLIDPNGNSINIARLIELKNNIITQVIDILNGTIINNFG